MLNHVPTSSVEEILAQHARVVGFEREYQEALVEKFKYMPEVKRIKKHTHVPRAILKAAAVKQTVQANQRKREKNRRDASGRAFARDDGGPDPRTLSAAVFRHAASSVATPGTAP